MSNGFMTEYEAKGPKFECETGPQNAVCCGVFDLGMQKNTFNGETKVKRGAILMFEIEELDNEGKPKVISKQYSSINLSKNSAYRSSLQKHLESWRGRPFTEEEIESGFDLYSVWNVPCTLTIEQNDKGYFNITNVTKKFASAVKMVSTRFPNDQPPEWIQKKINEQVKQHEDNRSQGYQKTEQYADSGWSQEGASEDDIPF